MIRLGGRASRLVAFIAGATVFGPSIRPYCPGRVDQSHGERERVGSGQCDLYRMPMGHREHLDHVAKSLDLDFTLAPARRESRIVN